MKKKTHFLAGLLFAALLVLELPAQMQAAYRTVKLRLVSSSKIAWSRVYVDGRYRGTVRRSRFLTLRLRTGKNYYFSIARSWDGTFYSRYKNEYISDSGSTKYVYFSPIKRGEEGLAWVRVRLSSTAKPAWMDVQLYYGKKFGKVRRGGSLRVPVPAGKRMRVVVRRVWQGNIHRKTKYLTLDEGETRSVYMRPVDIGAASKYGSSNKKTTVRCRLTSSSKIAWGRLYVNGRYRGRVRRSRYLNIKLRAGRRYTMTVKRRWNGRNWFRQKRVYVKKTGRQIEFFHPMAKSGSDSGSSRRRINVKLTSSSKIAWGRLYVNGRYKTTVRRGSSRYIYLKAGRSYRFEVKRRWNGKNWLRRKTVHISSGSSTKTIYFHPMAKSGSGGSKAVLKVRLTRASRVAWANLSVDGEQKGKVRRTRYLRVNVTGGKYYTLVLTRTYRGNKYRARKRVYVSSRGGSKTVMMTPKRRD